MKRNIISLILNSLLFVLLSIFGIGKAIAESSWMTLVYGGLIAIYLITTIDDIRYVVQLTRTRKELTRSLQMKK